MKFGGHEVLRSDTSGGSSICHWVWSSGQCQRVGRALTLDNDDVQDNGEINCLKKLGRDYMVKTRSLTPSNSRKQFQWIEDTTRKFAKARG